MITCKVIRRLAIFYMDCFLHLALKDFTYHALY